MSAFYEKYGFTSEKEYYDFIKEGEHFDMILYADRTGYLAHRFILAATSPYLEHNIVTGPRLPDNRFFEYNVKSPLLCSVFEDIYTYCYYRKIFTRNIDRLLTIRQVGMIFRFYGLKDFVDNLIYSITDDEEKITGSKAEVNSTLNNDV